MLPSTGSERAAPEEKIPRRVEPAAAAIGPAVMPRSRGTVCGASPAPVFPLCQRAGKASRQPVPEKYGLKSWICEAGHTGSGFGNRYWSHVQET